MSKVWLQRLHSPSTYSQWTAVIPGLLSTDLGYSLGIFLSSFQANKREVAQMKAVCPSCPKSSEPFYLGNSVQGKPQGGALRKNLLAQNTFL